MSISCDLCGTAFNHFPSSPSLEGAVTSCFIRIAVGLNIYQELDYRFFIVFEVMDSSKTGTSLSRNAYNLTKTLDSTATGLGESSETPTERKKRIQMEKQKLRDLEAEVMGAVKKGIASKTDIRERNLSQMISVLHMRLASLEKMTSSRMELVKEDVKTDSTKSSSDGPKLGDDLEDILKNDDAKGGTGTGKGVGHGGNLVTWMEGVHLDPHHLTLRTKQGTETAKKLEASLEDAFGSTNTRDFRGQKKSGGGGTKKDSRKNEQAKSDAKKQVRLKLEKRLQTNMESFVTRSVLDPEVIFTAPSITEIADFRDANEGFNEWPISVRWSNHDPRSARPDNAEGEMVPILLLKLALERIQIPSHELLFRWLVAQPCCQSYFVLIFWLMKIKFFQNENSEENEKFLMHELSADYAVLIASIAQRTHSEDEKDHLYKYLPYVLGSAVYFGFYFLCPGSRHLYTKGFRKTILMQLVQMMSGIQLCPVSVKVNWGVLFPEEAHDDDDQGKEGGAETIPMQSVLGAGIEAEKTKKNRSNTQPLEVPQHILDKQQEEAEARQAAIPVYTLEERLSKSLHAQREEQLQKQWHLAQTARHGARLAGDGGDEGVGNGHRKSAMDDGELMPFDTGGVGSGSANQEESNTPLGGRNKTTLPPLHNSASTPMINAVTGLHSESGEDDGTATTGKGRSRPATADLPYPNPSAAFEDPLTRTYLRAPLTRPGKHFTTSRQHVEMMNAQNVSPLMQQLLGWEDAAGRKVQPLFRTVPISWCPAGGSDTHKKRTVKKELHDRMAKEAAKSHKEFHHESVAGHKRRLATTKQVEKRKNIMMHGPQNRVSQYALDLIKARRLKDRGGGNTKEEDIEADIDLNAAFYDDGDLDQFLEEFD